MSAAKRAALTQLPGFRPRGSAAPMPEVTDTQADPPSPPDLMKPSPIEPLEVVPAPNGELPTSPLPTSRAPSRPRAAAEPRDEEAPPVVGKINPGFRLDPARYDALREIAHRRRVKMQTLFIEAIDDYLTRRGLGT